MRNRLPSSARLMLPGNKFGEVIELPRVCSIFDKPYVARYRRGQDGALVLLDVQPIRTVATPGRGSAAPISVPANAIDDSQERCPWCSNKGQPVRCDNCASWLCHGGVSKKHGGGLWFQCRASCGTNGDIGAPPERWTWEGRKARERQQSPSKPGLPSAREGKPLPAPPKPALPSGKVRGFLKS
jgi:hypothetical protein